MLFQCSSNATITGKWYSADACAAGGSGRRRTLREELRDQRDERDLVHRQRLQVEQNVRVHDARRRQRVGEQHAAALERALLRRDRLHLALEVGEADARDGGEVLLRVLFELRL